MKLLWYVLYIVKLLWYVLYIVKLNLLNPASSQQQVLAAATVIAKHTSVLCNACKVASGKTSNPVAKRHFVQAAKEVANSTANLVKNIKVLSLMNADIFCGNYFTKFGYPQQFYECAFIVT